MKFQVGDKVEVILSEHCSLNEVGDMGTITKLGPTDALVIVKERASVVGSNEYGGWHTFDELKLVKPKQTKNQRITALEKEVERIPVLEKEVESLKSVLAEILEIKKPTEIMKAIPSTVDEPPYAPIGFETVDKSPNQQRAEIIEKAKKFVEGHIPIAKVGTTPVTSQAGDIRIQFVVNVEKRTVVALPYLAHAGVITRPKGIAKCNPSDVFNEHIGKAIALGRALGLDVSEFEQAVQPTFAIGQVVENQNRISNPYSNKPFTVWKVGEKDIYEGPCGWTPSKYLTIINDTNAIYEMEVK